MQALATLTVDSSSELIFTPVAGNSEKMKDLREIFQKVLTPLYGSQESALKKIEEGTDRKCYLLCEKIAPVGVIVFKTCLSNEFAEHKIEKSIEIKSLFVVDAEKNSGRGIGTKLLNKIIEEAEKLKLNHESFHVTVSETKTESLTFFKQKKFNIVHAWKDLYKKGVTEYLLSRPAQLSTASTINVISKDIPAFSKKISESKVEAMKQFPEKQKAYSNVFIVKNAHWDDIHALKLLSDGTIVSGSKDNSLIKWSQEGELIKVISEVEPVEVDSKDWITAVGILNDEYWVSGERNGRIRLWNTMGEYISNLQAKLPVQNTSAIPTINAAFFV